MVCGLISFASVSKVCGFLEGREWLVFCLGEFVVCSYSFFRLFFLSPSLISLGPVRCVFFLEAFVPTSQPDPKDGKTAGE